MAMSDYTLPDFKIDKSNVESGIIDLLKIINSEWKPNSIKMEALSGGNSSLIYKCFNEDDPETAVTIRIRNLIDNFAKYTTASETTIIQKMSQLGHFPKIRAIFENGYCYDFVKGKPMMNITNYTGVITDKMLRAMAKELAFIHSVDISDYVENEKMHIKPYKELVGEFQTGFKHPMKPTESQFNKETAFISELLEKLKLDSSQCLCHGDFHYGNIVWDEETEKACFVDWELVGIGHQFHDLGYFLSTPTMFKITGSRKTNQYSFPDNANEKFLRSYYEEWSRLKNMEFTEKKLAELKTQVNIAVLGNYWRFGCFPITFPDGIEALVGDKYEYFEETIKSYLTHKKEFLGRNTLEPEDQIN